MDKVIGLDISIDRNYIGETEQAIHEWIWSKGFGLGLELRCAMRVDGVGSWLDTHAGYALWGMFFLFFHFFSRSFSTRCIVPGVIIFEVLDIAVFSRLSLHVLVYVWMDGVSYLKDGGVRNFLLHIHLDNQSLDACSLSRYFKYIKNLQTLDTVFSDVFITRCCGSKIYLHWKKLKNFEPSKLTSGFFAPTFSLHTSVSSCKTAKVEISYLHPWCRMSHLSKKKSLFAYLLIPLYLFLLLLFLCFCLPLRSSPTYTAEITS